MKPSLRFASLVIAWIRQSLRLRLRLLREDLRQSVPQQAPVLVPIPISAERHTRPSDRRHPAPGD